MIYQARRFDWKERITGSAAAVPLIALWWIPTEQRYRGGLLAPIRYSGNQVQGLAQGVLTGHLTIHAAVKAFHAFSGVIMTWGLLTPFVFLGAIAFLRNSMRVV